MFRTLLITVGLAAILLFLSTHYLGAKFASWSPERLLEALTGGH